jgi:hypothetical protein
MRDAVLAGKKTMTSRSQRYANGEHFATSQGKKFARIKVTDSYSTNWEAILNDRFKEEGFESPEQMRAWAVANSLGHYAQLKTMWTHTFEVLEKL